MTELRLGSHWVQNILLLLSNPRPTALCLTLHAGSLPHDDCSVLTGSPTRRCRPLTATPALVPSPTPIPYVFQSLLSITPLEENHLSPGRSPWGAGRAFVGVVWHSWQKRSQAWGGMSHVDGGRGRNHQPGSRETGLLCSPSMSFPWMFTTTARRHPWS